MSRAASSETAKSNAVSKAPEITEAEILETRSGIRSPASRRSRASPLTHQTANGEQRWWMAPHKSSRHRRRDYFKRRPFDKESAREHGEKVRARFEKATPEEQALVLIGVEALADFMDTAYAQRETLRPDAGEWNTWWNYFIDC
jgi:hypothetical protein